MILNIDDGGQLLFAALRTANWLPHIQPVGMTLPIARDFRGNCSTAFFDTLFEVIRSSRHLASSRLGYPIEYAELARLM